MSKKSFIPFNKPFFVGKELSNIAEAVTVHGHISGDGPFTKKCHKWLEENLHCRMALLTHSCTAALEMSALLCDIQPGDEIIIPSFTFVSTANAFVLRGAVPVFVDIRRDTLNLDEQLLESAITEKTKAVVPVHYAGVSCAMNKIMEVADRNNLFVIEDAAQGLFSKYNNQFLGTIGHLGCLSFHETKNIISGEGGALLINDPRFSDRAEYIREKGTNRNKFFRGEIDKYTWVDIGSSYLPSELVSAFLYAQLEQAKNIIAKRSRSFALYVELLSSLESNGFAKLPTIDENSLCNGHIFYIITRSLSERTALIRFLKEKNIHSVFHYVPLHSSPAGKKYCRIHQDMTVTDEISDQILRLPLFYELEEEDVRYICECVLEYYENL